MLQIGICDDEPMGLSMVSGAVEKALQKKGRKGEIRVFSSSEALAKELCQGRLFQMLFLDICMPGLDGIGLGTRFTKELSGTLLVFVSSREDLVFESFQARPFRFIRKASFASDFPGVMDAILEELQRREGGKLSFPGQGGDIFLDPADIVYLESLRKKQIIHCKREVVEVRSSFAALEEQLTPYGFVKTHKSYLVNSHSIRSIRSGFLTLDDGTQIPVGRTRAAQVKEAFRKVAMGSFSLGEE